MAAEAAVCVLSGRASTSTEDEHAVDVPLLINVVAAAAAAAAGAAEAVAVDVGTDIVPSASVTFLLTFPLVVCLLPPLTEPASTVAASSEDEVGIIDASGAISDRSANNFASLGSISSPYVAACP